MHDAWLIDDVWRLIADYLEDEDFGVLAQTCKALFPLASAERWKTITSFSCFLACLPSRHQTIPLQVQDLDRLNYYSTLVQKIILGDKGDDSQPLRVPPRYDAALQKQKRELLIKRGGDEALAEKRKKQEERRRIKEEKKRNRRRKRGLPEPPEPDRVSKEPKEKQLDLGDLKLVMDKQHKDTGKQNEEPQPEDGKIWGELWAEIATLRSQLQFLPNLRRITIQSAACDYLVPLTGISGSYIENILIRDLQGQKSSECGTNFLYRLQDVLRLQYLFVRDGMDLVPKKVIARAPLRHLRLDPRISRGGFFASAEFKLEPVPVGILNKATLEHLSIGLSREWYVYLPLP
jgi:hypothetical protein